VPDLTMHLNFDSASEKGFNLFADGGPDKKHSTLPVTAGKTMA
jgi:hypothetical protein